MAGAVALGWRVQHPVAVLFVAYATTLAYAVLGYPEGPVYFSLIVAFCTALLTGHRVVAWATIVSGWVTFLWLPPLFGTGDAPSWATALGLGAWLLVLATTTEIVRIGRERAVERRRAREEEERLRTRDDEVHRRLDLRASYQITMAGLAATRIFSAAGAGGIVLTYWALRKAGMPRRRAACRMVAFLVLTYFVYTAALVIFGVLLRTAVLPGRAPLAGTVVPAAISAGIIILFGLIALTLPLARRRLVWWLFLLAMLLVWPQMFLVDFAAGLLLAEAVIKRPQFTLHKAPTFALLAVAIILGSVSSGFPGPWVPRLGRFYALPTLLSAFLLVYLAVRSRAVVSLLHFRPLVWLGERSFALYAIHALTIHSVGQGISVLCLKAGISPLGSAAVGLIICFAVTFWLSDWLTKAIDRPSVAFSNSVGKWFAGVPAAPAGKEAVATPTDLPPALVSSPMRE